ncbi:EcsC family protein [Mucilaginibacter sp. UR6-1]|uniref:EcsC family protein n=1 Tax=Mucilaginibacter sp. UR6-1 TaxID=1435643 RepID=UPI001E51A937|nr:EcsC family protein [Mucilaginibacter sp. UR6-1]MCC8408645.1 EcsC family protein [Mucilaginibacter sp. UR6-1]
MRSFKEITAGLKHQADTLAQRGFRQIFDRIDQFNIKKGVDKLGLEGFINQCAYLAAGTGVLSGTGGVLTMALGIPFDVVNLITQQFRITMAINYYKKGTYKISFDEFMKIVAASLKVEASIALTKNVLEAVAEKLMLKLGARAAQRLVPVVGAVIGGTANYLFIKRMAESVKDLHGKDEVIKL